MGLPVEILNQKKYERKSFEFNFGFIVSPLEYEDQDKRHVYEQLLRKMATYLTILEVEHEFLWDLERKRTVEDICRNLYQKLVSSETLEQISFTLPFDYQNTFMFHFQMSLNKTIDIESYQVPIFQSPQLCKDYSKAVVSTSDILHSRICPYIDGQRHLKQIANLAEVDLDIVKMCIQTLKLYGIVEIIDIFQYSNLYGPCPKIT